MARDRYLLTGASGFVGSHVLRHLLANTDADIVAPVSFRYHGNADRIILAARGYEADFLGRVKIMHHDLLGPFSATQLHDIGHIDTMLNLASESHVDRSIEAPVPFIQHNVSIMLNMLEAARAINPSLFIQISTDEVYGPAPDHHRHREWESIIPSNPYSASKASQEAIATSYWRTYGVPVVITNTMNIIGETQDKEKFIPKTMRAILQNQFIDAHVDNAGKPSSRFYLHARNQADALLYIASNMDAYMYPHRDRPLRLNVVGEREVDAIEMINIIASFMGDDSPNISPVNFHASRPGHDMRYALDGDFLANLGWTPPIPFHKSLQRTVEWTLANPKWLK